MDERDGMVLWILANAKKNTLDLGRHLWRDYGVEPKWMCRIKFRTKDDAIRFVGLVQDMIACNAYRNEMANKYVYLEVRGFAEFLRITPALVRE